MPMRSNLANQIEATRTLAELTGGMDIYLLDQIVKGRFAHAGHILDAGCGGGRNIEWFLRSGCDVSAVDISPGAVEQLQQMAAHLAPTLPTGNFRVEPVEALTFDSSSFDAVFSIAVLHFARDESHFSLMMGEMWRVLRPGGILFARLGSTVGIEHLVRPLGGRRFAVPDGSTRFLVDIAMLERLSVELGARLMEPIKTVNVQNLRCMTTWVVEKR